MVSISPESHRSLQAARAAKELITIPVSLPVDKPTATPITLQPSLNSCSIFGLAQVLTPTSIQSAERKLEPLSMERASKSPSSTDAQGVKCGISISRLQHSLNLQIWVGDASQALPGRSSKPPLSHVLSSVFFIVMLIVFRTPWAPDGFLLGPLRVGGFPSS